MQLYMYIMKCREEAINYSNAKIRTWLTFVHIILYDVKKDFYNVIPITLGYYNGNVKRN